MINSSSARAPGRRPFPVVFTVLMLLFCLFLFVFVPLHSVLAFRLSDTALSLETSQGRERKQQYEYDQVTAQLPLTRAELEETQPLADAVKQEVDALKEERKALRAEKKRLEELLSQALSDETPVSGEEADVHD